MSHKTRLDRLEQRAEPTEQEIIRIDYVDNWRDDVRPVVMSKWIKPGVGVVRIEDYRGHDGPQKQT